MSTIFDVVASEIEQRSDLDEFEDRGTIRLGLEDAGFDAGAITLQQMTVFLEERMPGALTRRGVGDVGPICRCRLFAASIRDFRQAVEEHGSVPPEIVFARLVGH